MKACPHCGAVPSAAFRETRHGADCPRNPRNRRAAARRSRRHGIEDASSGVVLELRPADTELGVEAIRVAHPPCIAAHDDGGMPCGECAWILYDPECQRYACRYFAAHMDDEDDRRGASS